jgi:hypothetical protein
LNLEADIDILMLEMTKEHNSKYFSEIGKMGARARYEKHGNPGTKEGRSRGGINAIKTHAQKGETFFKQAKIVKIKKNKMLAEFLGILFGDGHVGGYQTTITLDSETDAAYVKYVVELIEQQFQVRAYVRKRKHARAVEICISSISFCKQMVGYGMVAGNKLKGDFRIPNWIQVSDLYLKGFLRGLFDTDGSIYLERKKIKNKTYCYVGMIITSASPTLRNDLVIAFRRLNFSPTNTSIQNSVFLRRKSDIQLYFNLISSHNLKHKVRYAMFLKEM